MHKFEYLDGTVIEFDDFTRDQLTSVYCTLPSEGRGYSSSAYLYIDEDTARVLETYRMKDLPADELAKTRVGILSHRTRHPFPKGIYIPYKLESWYSGRHLLDGLYSTFIFNKQYQNHE